MAATTRIIDTQGRLDLSVSTIRVIGALVLLGIWQGLALSGFFFRDVVPPLQKIAYGLIALFANGAFYANLAVTGGELALALVIGSLAGVLAGLLLGGSQVMSDAYESWLSYLGPTPKIILFPVMIMLFGVDAGSKVAMGAVSCFFPIAISVASGIHGVDPTLRRVGRSFQANAWQVFLKIELPAMTATLVNGFRLGFGVAMIGVLLAETKLSNQGIGFMIINAYTRFDMPQMYALLIVTIAFAAVVNAFAVRMARRFGARAI
ncbi:ABC transporter permease subunit [Rhizobium rhizogenes]|uniref:Taurine uptake ABC transporter n=1 Tax=Rhizobium rhizogenes (strain K84 / ATCC BAA-868) TaxID=311403 RepID=B9JM56_RHIR8|nr:ABC transporter permease subunit [Rhizobium rhizogenes]ACM28770.1 taurine uptake ABC transporter [Rhizobium rhizogenes K84]OCJ18966.1 taurine ABC transporter [Agrobacterium sp. B131/95]NTI24442.1 ABC transporter permease subunit [Rhizobium rhizogenes]NTI43762.1 ABC transporter permease subunit [Rhizobium rhizogenes]NTI63737.1 ABC transporter permease subunit [Rhizobium rhizogenes]